MIGSRRRYGTVWLDGVRIGESEDVVVVEGTAYFPIEDIRPGALEPSKMKSLCYWKGVASYFHVSAGHSRRMRSAWTYRHPSPLARVVKGRVAFWADVDVRLDDRPADS